MLLVVSQLLTGSLLRPARTVAANVLDAVLSLCTVFIIFLVALLANEVPTGHVSWAGVLAMSALTSVYVILLLKHVFRHVRAKKERRLQAVRRIASEAVCRRDNVEEAFGDVL